MLYARVALSIRQDRARNVVRADPSDRAQGMLTVCIFDFPPNHLQITTAVVSSPFVLTFPECSFTVDYGTFPVLDITVQPMSLTLPTMFSNGGLDFFFNVTIESMDTEMVGPAYSCSTGLLTSRMI